MQISDSSLRSACIKTDRKDAILSVGGPGDPITPREQGEMLFDLMGRQKKFRSVPVSLVASISSVMTAVARVLPIVADKAEFSRIAYYYATESMLVWDPAAQRYDADATPVPWVRHAQSPLSAGHRIQCASQSRRSCNVLECPPGLRHSTGKAPLSIKTQNGLALACRFADHDR